MSKIEKVGKIRRILGVAAGLLLTGAWGLSGCAHSAPAAAPTAEQSREKNSKEVSMIRPAMAPAELAAKAARYAPVRIDFDRGALDARQVQAIELLVKASRLVDDLFWKQASANGPLLRARLAKPADADERLMARYLGINYGAYDRLDDFAPFLEARAADGSDLVGTKPLGATFYPEDLTPKEWEQHLAAHPDDRQAFQSNFTVIRRRAGRLTAVPYSEAYADELTRAAAYLKQAAALVSDPELARFLESRAAAFASNDYFQSDMDWMDVTDSPLEVTIGPYEVYEDRLFNYKAAFESFVTLRDPVESDKLAKVAGYLTDMERNLPIPDAHKNFERGAASPIAVVDLIYSAGDTRAGVQTLAFNLPNDERVREKKGSKKVMLKNISHAKFDKILAPIAQRVIDPAQLPLVSFAAYFNHTLMHEVSHGLGPGFIEKDGQRTTVNLALKDTYSTIEEAKADVLGIYNTLYLVDRGLFPKELTDQCLVTFLAGVFRSVRFGVHEAHGRANAIASGYLLAHGAYRYDPETKKFSVDLAKAPAAVRDLAHELLMIEAEGDYQAAKDLIARHGSLGPEISQSLAAMGDIPVDIEPIFALDD